MAFQSTPSAWRETHWHSRRRRRGNISIHSLRMEGDVTHSDGHISVNNFNPLPPHGGRLRPWCYQRHGQPFQSTPSAWRETCGVPELHRSQRISIHSLRMEGDLPQLCNVLELEFQSTPSAWRETQCRIKAIDTLNISIHSLRMEGDQIRALDISENMLFQSTPSAWRETLFLV